MSDFQSPNSLRERTKAIERRRSAQGSKRFYGAIGTAIIWGSALITVLYFCLALGAAGVDGAPAWVGYLVGVLLGLLALGAGEASIVRASGLTRSDDEINTAQRFVLAAQGMAGVLSASVTTLLAISYLLPLSMPEQWLAVTGWINLINLGLGWLAVLTCQTLYVILSSESRVNAMLADAANRVDEAAANVTRQLSTKIEEGAEESLELIDVSREATMLIAARLGLDADRTQERLRLPEPSRREPEPGPFASVEDVARFVRESGLSEDDIREAIAYGRSLREANEAHPTLNGAPR